MSTSAIAMYLHYLFKLQHNTARIIVQKHMRLAPYNENNTDFAHENEQLKP
jgi:hypothetical protein